MTYMTDTDGNKMFKKKLDRVKKTQYIVYKEINGIQRNENVHQNTRRRIMKMSVIRRITVFLLLVTVFALPLVASGQQEADVAKEDQITIGWVEFTMSNPYFVELVDAGRRFSEKEGWNFIALDTNLDIQVELKNMEDLITKGVDAIVIDVFEPDAAVAGIREAVNAGIPVIAVDSSVNPAAPVVTTVQSANKMNGMACGNWYASVMKGEPIKAVMMSGVKGNPVGKTRRDGLFAGLVQGQLKYISGKELTDDEAWEEALKIEEALTKKGKASYPDANLEIFAQGWGTWNANDGLKAMEDMLVAHPYINTLLTENDDMAIGALKAIAEAGVEKQITIVAAADGQKEAYALIKEGRYGVTGENNPTKIATRAMEIVKEILNGADPNGYEKVIYTPAVAVHSGNVDEYYDPNANF